MAMTSGQLGLFPYTDAEAEARRRYRQAVAAMLRRAGHLETWAAGLPAWVDECRAEGCSVSNTAVLVIETAEAAR